MSTRFSANEAPVSDALRGRWTGIFSGLKSALAGFAIGLAYPCVATLVLLLRRDLPLSWDVALHLHASDEMLQLIDSIPVLLAIVMGFLGRSIARIDSMVATLEVRVAARTKALNEQRDKMEGSARAKARFLSRLSREIAGSMETIVRSTEVVLGTLLDARQHDQAQTAVKQARRVQDSMQSLQAVADIDAGEIEVREKVFSPRHLLSDAIARFEKRLSKRFELVVRYADELPLDAAADSTTVLKIFMTLLRAIVLNLEGGRINIDVAQISENQARQAVLSVEISSPDLFLPAHVVAHFFDAFERDDPTDFAQDTKLELELAVARRMAQVMRGDIGITSMPGGGTRLHMNLPYRLGVSPGHGQDAHREIELESVRVS
jgi:signal transduction histidine kinase